MHHAVKDTRKRIHFGLRVINNRSEIHFFVLSKWHIRALIITGSEHPQFSLASGDRRA